jgi:mutator protein MutT
MDKQAMIEVVCGVINQNGRYLITQRAKGVFASQWEFPGGKIEPGENPEQSLERELEEELSIRVKATDRLMENSIEVEGQKIKLIFLKALYSGGEIQLSDHIDYAWATPDQLIHFDLVPGDIPFAQRLQSGAFKHI